MAYCLWTSQLVLAKKEPYIEKASPNIPLISTADFEPKITDDINRQLLAVEKECREQEKETFKSLSKDCEHHSQENKEECEAKRDAKQEEALRARQDPEAQKKFIENIKKRLEEMKNNPQPPKQASPEQMQEIFKKISKASCDGKSECHWKAKDDAKRKYQECIESSPVVIQHPSATIHASADKSSASIGRLYLQSSFWNTDPIRVVTKTHISASKKSGVLDGVNFCIQKVEGQFGQLSTSLLGKVGYVQIKNLPGKVRIHPVNSKKFTVFTIPGEIFAQDATSGASVSLKEERFKLVKKTINQLTIQLQRKTYCQDACSGKRNPASQFDQNQLTIPNRVLNSAEGCLRLISPSSDCEC